MDFPQYRRYQNGLSYFQIVDENSFEEYKLFQGRIEKYLFKASILPDRNFIQDMLHRYEEHWEKISKEDFQTFLRAYPLKEA